MYRRGKDDPVQHPLVKAAEAQAIPATQFDGHAGALVRSIQGLHRKLEREQFSILHSHEYKTDLLAALAARRIPHRPALIATVRHTEPGLQMALFQMLDSLVLHGFDNLTVPSLGALEELRRWPILKNRARVIHHSVQAPDDWSAAPDLSLPTLPSRGAGPVISIVGRLQAVKGHRIFLQSARMVLKKKPEARFWIIGDGELRHELEAMACDLGIATAVSFLGYRKDAGHAMTLSDVVVCSSWYEALPRVVLEALSLERPVVATCVGGIPELIVEGETGLLAPAGDPEGIAEAVLRLLDDRDLARRLAAAGQKLVQQCYSLEAQASHLAVLYREALECT